MICMQCIPWSARITVGALAGSLKEKDIGNASPTSPSRCGQRLSWVGFHRLPFCCCKGFMLDRRQVKRLRADVCIKLHRALEVNQLRGWWSKLNCDV